MTRSLYAAALSAWWCCPYCEAVRLCCPGCAEPLQIRRPADHPPALPFHTGQIVCPDPACGAVLTLTVCGYRPNPTGDAPATRSPRSDRLPVIERPPLPRPQPAPTPAAASTTATDQQAPMRPAPRRGPLRIDGRLDLQFVPPPPRRPGPAWPRRPHAPCPPDAPRQRLSDWATDGLLPDGVPPASIAAAYRRLFGGAEPRRDRQTRIYSRRELRGCLWLLEQAQGQGVGQ